MASAVPITVWKTDGAGAPTVTRGLENDGETFKAGTPVTIDATGHVAEVSDPLTEIIVGISVTGGSNLTSAGTAETTSVGTPINQTSASVIPVGAPLNDGKVGYYHADGKTTFRVALVDGQTFSQALVSETATYELSKTANGYWAVDSTDTNSNGDNVIQIVGVDPNNDEFVLCRIHRADRVFD